MNAYSLSATVKKLCRGLPVPYETLPCALREEMLRSGVIRVFNAYGRLSFKAPDPRGLMQWMTKEADILRLEQKIDLKREKITTRAAQAAATGNSKAECVIRSVPGFGINCYEPLMCRLNCMGYMVEPVDGSFDFVCDYGTFTIPRDVIVIGVENMENFRMIRRQKKLFESCLGANERFLFVSRYPVSLDLRLWLLKIPNRFVWYGDFDLAGVNIFLTEFKNYLGERAELLIPPDLPKRLQSGSMQNYLRQLKTFAELRSDDPQSAALISMINRFQRCYDQEGYIVQDEA